MPWWGWVIIIVGLFLWSVFTSIVAGDLAFYYNLDKRIRACKPVYCMYSVVDKDTRKELFYGEKYRTVEGLVLTEENSSLIKKIYVYEKDDVICGRECKITFWVGDNNKNKKELICVTEEGRHMLESYASTGVIFNART